MNVSESLATIGMGAALGAAGQIAHALPGFKKMYASNAPFDASRFVVSLLIGAVAGILAAVGLVSANKINAANVDGQTWLALVGAGYAGTDFIEGLIGASGRPSGSTDSVSPTNSTSAA